MRHTAPTDPAPTDHLGITLALSEDQLHAIGLNKLPAAGAEVHIRATASVAHPDHADHSHDTDHDAEVDAHGGDTDGDEGNKADQENNADQNGPDQDEAGEAHAAALTLHLTGLTLMPVQRTPDKVLYGSGD